MHVLNIQNFRDISGYYNQEGKRMKKNKIFRGASLHQMSLDDAKYMEEKLGIRYILDYRDEKEALLHQDILSSHMMYKRIGALNLKGESAGFDFGELLSQEMSSDHLKLMTDYIQAGYRTMAFDNPAYHYLFDVLLRNDGHVYFHCSAGKDRTGISAFLVMIALGMSEEDAIKEYMLSNELLKEFVENFYKEHLISQDLRQYSDPLLYVDQRNIMLTIQAIKEKYRDYNEFLENEYHIDEHKRKILKSIYCE